jgi:hypothetical protein
MDKRLKYQAQIHTPSGESWRYENEGIKCYFMTGCLENKIDQ